MSQRLTNPTNAILGFGAISLLGCLVSWAIEGWETSPQDSTTRVSFVIGTASLVVAGISLALAEQWPVRVGGLGLLLGLGLIANLPSPLWFALLFVCFCILLAIGVNRRIDRT
jgi:hypothetical protein